MEGRRVMCCEDINYSTTDFVLFEEEIVECLKKTDTVNETEIMPQRQKKNLKSWVWKR